MNLHSIAQSKPLKRRKAFMPLDTPAPDTTLDKAPSEGAGASRAAEHAWATSSRAPVYGRGGSVPKQAPMPRAAPVAPKPPAMMGGITLGRGGMRKAPHAPGLVPKTISDKRGRKIVVYVRMDGVPQSTGVQKTLFDTLSASPKVNADPHQIEKMTAHTEAGAQDGIFNALPDRARSSKPHAIGSRVKVNDTSTAFHGKTGTVTRHLETTPLQYHVQHDYIGATTRHTHDQLEPVAANAKKLPALTAYQAAQLLHWQTTGDFKARNANGNQVGRKAWSQMLDTLVRGGYIREVSGRIQLTEDGRDYLSENHHRIAMSALD